MVKSVSAKNVIVTDDGRKYKKPSFMKKQATMTAGSLAGMVATGTISYLASKPGLAAFDSFKKLDNKAIREAAETAFKNSNLGKYGVEFVNVGGNGKAITNTFEEIMKKSGSSQDSINIVKKIMHHYLKKPTVQGKNAFFFHFPEKDGAAAVSKIFVNTKKAPLLSFHEMGHALNRHVSKAGKIMQYARTPGMIFASLVASIALMKSAKPDGEKPKGFWDKFTTSIKNNAGKLAFIGALPTVIEEGAASIRGTKLAKGLLSPENYKTLKMTNAKALLSYVGMAVGLGIGTALSVKIKDALTKPKEIKG